MRRRLAIAIVGLVVAALFLAGIGTIVLASVADRQDAEQDLREQVEAIGDLLTEQQDVLVDVLAALVELQRVDHHVVAVLRRVALSVVDRRHAAAHT